MPLSPSQLECSCWPWGGRHSRLWRCLCLWWCGTSSAVLYNAKLASLLLWPHYSPPGVLHIFTVPCSFSVFLFDSSCFQKLLLVMVWSVWKPSFCSTLSVGAQAMSGNFECAMHTVYTHICVLPLWLGWYVVGVVHCHKKNIKKMGQTFSGWWENKRLMAINIQEILVWKNFFPLAVMQPTRGDPWRYLKFY